MRSERDLDLKRRCSEDAKRLSSPLGRSKRRRRARRLNIVLAAVSVAVLLLISLTTNLWVPVGRSLESGREVLSHSIIK